MNITIPENGMLNRLLAEACFNLIDQLPQKGRLLETGTGYGHSAHFFSEILPEWHIYTVDAFGLFGDGRIYPRLDHDRIKQVIDHYKGGRIIQILGDSSSVPWELPLDVLYIDADHTEAGCRLDFNNYSPFLVTGGLLIFDDYIQANNPANGVKAVVDSIQGYERLFTGDAVILKKL